MSFRLAADIGGTFTDVVLEQPDARTTAKVLTTPGDPAEGVMDGVERVLERTGVEPQDASVMLHGTTLATNALIERRGAVTALLTTAGHRDALEMALENRFEQYDVNIDRPLPLVPRFLRLPVRERLDARGDVLLALDELSVTTLAPELEARGVESVAVGLLHSYANPVHEQRIAELLAKLLPGLSVSLSSQVCPEIREYERLSTTCANAYVKPLMATYLKRLEQRFSERGFCCPILLMTSGGGLTTLDNAAEYPIRLVESGPAGGAILATEVARSLGERRTLSFDMGGTTAKLCVIDDGEPLLSRSFEVDRSYRFRKGSGLPVRIPVIEMVEIGAGGGSIASLDKLGRIQVGPESAGSVPGPACYGRGGTRGTVTDADLLLGKLDPNRFAGGSMRLDVEAATAALDAAVGGPLELSATVAAYSVSEVVNENMAAAARAHLAEWGKSVEDRTLIAFGGAAPLHAGLLARKLKLDRIVIPADAGVGSAVGFLLSPVSYEVVRSHYMTLANLDRARILALVEEMLGEARGVVAGVALEPLEVVSKAYIRYLGQGHEIAVSLPDPIEAVSAAGLREAFEAAYRELYGRIIPDLDVEILSWTLGVVGARRTAAAPDVVSWRRRVEPLERREMFDAVAGEQVQAGLLDRAALAAGDWLEGPSLVGEPQTTVVVNAGYRLCVSTQGNLVIEGNRGVD